jgi:hypothetical protein
MKSEVTILPVANLEICPRVRVRERAPKDGADVVLDYAEAYQCGLITEPLEVFREKGTERYIVADGEHRLLALKRAKRKEVECRLYEGDEIDALDFGIRCNQKHGLRRTKADIYHALVRIMETPRLCDKYRTDTELSEQLGISIATVQRHKTQWRSSSGGDSRARAKKQAAQTSSKKHPGRPKAKKADLSCDKSKTSQKQEVTKKQLASPTISEPQKESPQQPAKTPEQAKARISQIVVSDVRRALGMLCDVPPGADLTEEFNAADWRRIKQAHAWLSDLLSREPA